MATEIALLAQPTRLHILRLVWDAEHTAGEIASAFTSTFGAISQHLARLHAAGLLTRRREWRTVYYRADRARLAPLAPLLEQLWAQQLGVLAALAEAEERTTARRARHKPRERTRHARARRSP